MRAIVHAERAAFRKAQLARLFAWRLEDAKQWEAIVGPSFAHPNAVRVVVAGHPDYRTPIWEAVTRGRL